MEHSIFKIYFGSIFYFFQLIFKQKQKYSKSYTCYTVIHVYSFFFGHCSSPKNPFSPETTSLGRTRASLKAGCQLVNFWFSAEDPDSEDSRRALLKTLHQIKNHKNFKQGIPELDPVGEMNIKTEEICVFFGGGLFGGGVI